MPRKIRRLSGPAVAIGYIFLIPSILGMAACAILFIVGLFAAITAANHGSAFGTAFAGLWNLFDMLIGVGCFVGGLVGWLLIMKKHVLQCVYCGAVVDAAAPIALQPNQSRVNARNVVLGVLLILGITGVIWAFIEADTQTSTPTATTAEPAQPTPDNSAATVQPSSKSTDVSPAPVAPQQETSGSPSAPQVAPESIPSFQPSSKSTDVSPAPVAPQQETSRVPSPSQIAEITNGMTPDQVVAILGPPIYITQGPVPNYGHPCLAANYGYPNGLTIVFRDGKVSRIAQIQ